MADKAVEQVKPLVGIKKFKDFASVDDEHMRLKLNRIERRSREIGKNNRIILAACRGNTAVNYPDGLEHENAIHAFSCSRPSG